MRFRWGSDPFIRVVFPFALGIIAREEWGFWIPGVLFLLVLCAIGLMSLPCITSIASRYTRRHWHGYLIFPIYFLSGLVLAEATIHTGSINHYSRAPIAESDLFMIKVLDFATEKANSTRYEVELIGFGDSIFLPTTGKVLLYMEKSDSQSVFLPGTILLTGADLKEIEGPKNPGEFNYKKYMRYRGIDHRLNAKSIDTKELEIDPPLFSLSYHLGIIRNKLIGLLDSGPIEKRELGVLAALVLGERDLLDPEVFKAFSAAGAMHVLAVSGLHVGLFYVVVLWLFNKVAGKRRWKWIRFVVVASALWFYAGVTGFSPSVSRAATMFTFIALGTSLNRPYSIYNSLAESAFILMVINPRILFEVGFQLSYLAVLGIVLWARAFETIWNPPNVLLDKSWQLICVSFAAQLATFPLGMLYFHQFPTYFLVSNLFVIPAATVLLYLTLAFFILSPIPIISGWMQYLLNILTYWLNELVALVERFPFAQIKGVSISVFEVYAVYGFIIFSIFYLTGKSRKFAFLAMFCLLIISAEEAIESYKLNRISSACVHAVNNRVAVTIYRSGKGYFLNSDSLYQDENKLSYLVGHYWDDLEIERPQEINIDRDSVFVSENVYWQRPVLLFGSGELLVVSGQNDAKFINSYPNAVVLLNGKSGVKALLKSEEIPSQGVVLTNFSSRYYIGLMDSLAGVSGFTHINLPTHGYYPIEAR